MTPVQARAIAERVKRVHRYVHRVPEHTPEQLIALSNGSLAQLAADLMMAESWAKAARTMIAQHVDMPSDGTMA